MDSNNLRHDIQNILYTKLDSNNLKLKAGTLCTLFLQNMAHFRWQRPVGQKEMSKERSRSKSGLDKKSANIFKVV
jgi:hypothetical protein